MKSPYVYKLTDLTTGKWYIGSSYRKGADTGKLGVIYFSSSRVVKKIYSANPERFVKEILVIGDSDYVQLIERRLLVCLDAKNDISSYNMHNGCSLPDDINLSKVAEYAAKHNREHRKAVYAEGFYESEQFKKGAVLGGKISSSHNKAFQKGIFKPGFYKTVEFLNKCSEIGKKNANNKRGITGRSVEQMREDAKKAAYKMFTCSICGKEMNAGNLARHVRANH